MTDRIFIGMSDIPQDEWERIFGKKNLCMMNADCADCNELDYCTYKRYPKENRKEYPMLEEKTYHIAQMGHFVDYAVLPDCQNLEESYGEICVKCNKCGRFTKIRLGLCNPRKRNKLEERFRKAFGDNSA